MFNKKNSRSSTSFSVATIAAMQYRMKNANCSMNSIAMYASLWHGTHSSFSMYHCGTQDAHWAPV